MIKRYRNKTTGEISFCKTVKDGDKIIVNPPSGLLTKLGWEVLPDPKPVPLSYGERVNLGIRTKYSLSEELSILRQRDSKPEEYAAYNAFCEAQKAQVKEEIENEKMDKEGQNNN